METATLAGGCFWCTEAIFQRLKGVKTIISGYTGGTIENPTYEHVSRGTTGHAEAIQITFDPTVISFETLLDVFWKLHDPTTKNQQGADFGTQYRSGIFYHNENQKKVAEQSKTKTEKLKLYPNPIVTEITPFTVFYQAENTHQNFYNSNRSYGYCNIIIDPKIQKLYKEFKEIVAE